MRRVAFAAAGLVMLAGPAFAQYYGLRPSVPIGPMPADSVFEMVRGMGLEPMGPPTRYGPYWMQRAADYYGKPLRVTVDAHRAQVVSVEHIAGAPMIHSGSYASTGAPYGRRPHYGAMPDDDLVPPGSALSPYGQPPQQGMPQQYGVPPQQQTLPPAAHQPKPATKSAALPPPRTPVPRKRPAAAPQETAGSVEPLQPAAPAQAPAAQSAAPAAKPDTSAIPPVAPLE